MEGETRSRRTTTIKQLEHLLDFAEAHKDLACGKLRNKEAKEVASRLWQQCTYLLNPEGPKRKPKEWMKVWNDMKSRVRTKLLDYKASQISGSGSCSRLSLTPFENRVACIIGLDLGSIPNDGSDQHHQDVTTPMEAGVKDPLTESSNDESYMNSSPVPEINIGNGTSKSPEIDPLMSRRKRSLSASSSLSPPRCRQRQSPQTRAGRDGMTKRTKNPQDEAGAMMVRIEELRAHTDHLMAQAILKQAEAAHIQAETAKAQVIAANNFNNILGQAIQSLLPALRNYLERNSNGHGSERKASSEENVNQT